MCLTYAYHRLNICLVDVAPPSFVPHKIDFVRLYEIYEVETQALHHYQYQHHWKTEAR